MTGVLHRLWPVLVVAFVIIGTLFLEIRPYDFRLSSVFHMDAIAGADNPMPEGFVILSVPSYDGAQYYHVARNIPKMFSADGWEELRTTPPLSYSYQRFLLPLLAFVLSMGSGDALPFTFVLINISSLLLATWVLLKSGVKPIYSIALALCPAATLAMHFTLAEPLTLFLLALFLTRYLKLKKIEAIDVLLLSLAVITREINILFVGYMFIWSLWKKNWKDSVVLFVPAAIFFGFHLLLYYIFGDVPFMTSAGASTRQLPGSAIVDILIGKYGWNGKSLSTIALLIFFFIPCVLFTMTDIIRKRSLDVLSFGALAFFSVMFTMPDYIWGSVTSIGRVITPVYPLSILLLASRDTATSRTIAAAITILGTAVGIGLGLVLHPFTLA